MTTSPATPVKTFVLIALGFAIAAMGLYVANADDAPGAAVIGFLLMIASVVFGVKSARNRLSIWAGRSVLVVGILIAGFAAFLTHAVTVSAALFLQPKGVPSVGKPAPAPEWAGAVDRARSIVRAGILEQNLPGVSIAVGTGAGVVWAEGFGWRDVSTKTPVTPETRFNIGTAARTVQTNPAASAGLTSTGTDSPAKWSPEAIGEPGEDFPLFTLLRHVIFQPLGFAPEEYPLPGERATFYVPRSEDNDPRRGRRLMFMRDLACCAGDMTFYSTPTDLVRFALATNAESVDGDLAGGRVMSLVTRRDGGIVVAVTSNIAHADTAALALKVADAFAQPK